jgi:hypothetical protein
MLVNGFPLVYLLRLLWLAMQEVASFSINTTSITEISDTFLGLIFAIVVAVLTELGCSMCELTLLIIGTIAYCQIVPAQFILQFVVGRSNWLH